MSISRSTHDYASTRVEITIDVAYDLFVRGVEALFGTIDLDALRDLAKRSEDVARAKLESFVGESDFTLFQRIDHGALLTVFAGRPSRAMTYVFGNALIAVEMTRHVPMVGLYVPLRLFLQEIPPGRVLVTYDLPSSTLGQFDSPAVNAVAHTLDAKVERLVIDAATRQSQAASDTGRSRPARP
jgi:hypothetical protein